MTPSPLAKKLQIKAGSKVLLLNAPARVSLEPLPEGSTLARTGRGRFDVVHLFVRSTAEVETLGPRAIAALREGGILWVSYPKQSAGMETDLTRDRGWRVLRDAGWGAVSQVAVNETWSALRFRPGAATQAESRKAGRTARASASARPPADLVKALARSAPARSLWGTMAPSHRREYVSWIEEAKRPETRAARVAKAVEMMASGQKDRNARYRK